MSVFTNAVSSPDEERSGYVAAVLGLVGDADPVEILERTPDAIRVALAESRPDGVSRREAPGKWSMAHVIQHMADSEVVWGYRLRMVLAHDRPVLHGYDQDLWADRLCYDIGDVGEAIELFATLRAANLALLRRVGPAAWSRVALHAERGEETVAHMVSLYAGHDELHLRQLARIQLAVEAGA